MPADEKQPTPEERTPQDDSQPPGLYKIHFGASSTTFDNHPADKNELFKKTDFHIVFRVDVADARVKAKVVSSDDLRTGEPTLADLRALGNLYEHFHTTLFAYSNTFSVT